MSDASEEIIDDPVEVRRNKRQALIDAGRDPYGHAFASSHTVEQLDEQYARLEDGQDTWTWATGSPCMAP